MKKGFTLIELLAVITVLAIVLAIAIPRLSGINNKVRKSTFETNSNGIISVCRNHYQSNYASRLDTNEIVYKIENGKITINGKDVRYNEGEINEEGQITINEDGESKGYVTNGVYCGIKEYKTSIEVHEMTEGEECGSAHQIYLTTELNGGTLEPSIEGNYIGGSSINLTNPTKRGYNFNKWEIIKGSGRIEGNILKINHTDVTIYALYVVAPALTVDKNGGSSNQEFEENYTTGTVIELEDLEKRGYIFTGWELVSGDSILSGKTLTIGLEDTNIKGMFELASYTCAGGTYLKKGEISCTTCEAGSYCPGGTYNYNEEIDQGITGCPGGVESPAGSSSITACKVICAAGEYLKKGEISCSTCEANSYCSGGSYNYNENINQGISSCPSGFTNSAGSIDATSCKKTCSAGTYLQKNSATCASCPAGKYCVGGTFNFNETNDQGITGNCNAGTYSTGGASAATCTACGGSLTSSAGSTAKTACKITCSGGTYLAKSGSACSNCPAGSACAGGTYNYSDSGNQGISQCGANKYSGAKASSCSNCPSGFSSSAGSTSATSCKKTCAAGTYLQANSATCATCTAGNYCTGGTWSKSASNQGLTSCGTGKISDAGAKAASSCYTMVKTFNYTGGIQTFKAPVAGKYKFEVWGAQGGHDVYDSNWQTYGGKGGYASGEKWLNSNQIVYICIGGAGADLVAGGGGGYNGGGNSGGVGTSGAGGGATHMALTTGLLKDVSNSNLIIAAGGGGGAGSALSDQHDGGAGSGGNGASSSGGGGTQSSGGSGENAGSRGQGGSRPLGPYDGGGGGGGYYGGGAATYDAGGGGGSGYTSGLSNVKIDTGIREGNGQAKITFVSY